LEGERFVRRARDLLSGWESLRPGRKQESPHGILNIGAVHTIVSGVLPHALKRLRTRRPNLEIRLTTGLAHELEAGVRRGSLDVAVLPQSDAIEPGLVWQPFCTEWLSVIAESRAKGDTDSELLTRSPFIRLRRVAWGLGRLIDQELARRNINVSANMEVDTLEGIMSLVSNGIGVSIVPKRPIPRPFMHGIRSVAFGDPPLSRTISVLQKQVNSSREFVQDLYDDLAAVTEKHAKP
jgi:DNA-binding transcriptional LysR family regulator